MRKQKLPKEFWTDIKLSDRNTYCVWYADGKMKKCQVQTQKEARDFVKRAEEHDTAAFAAAFVEAESENQIFVCSFKGVLKKYEFKDWVRLEIAGANYKMIHYPQEKANSEASTRSVEQWNKKGYGRKYLNNAEYYVSWYNANLHKFEGEKYATLNEAEAKFKEKQQADMPVRLVEGLKDSKRIHEIKAACQHWHIGMGNYLEQLANKTLPIGEIPYIFSNQYLTSEMKVENDFGYLDFHVGFKDYSIQIHPARGTGSTNSASIMVDSLCPSSMTYYVIIDDNPIIAPWLARIERQL